MREPQRVIYLFSVEPWGDMWYSKQHYAAQLAKDHCVYFINAPPRWSIPDLFSFTAKVRMTPEGVHVVDYRNNLPPSFLPRGSAQAVHRFNAWKIKRLPRAGKPLFWCFHPDPVVQQRTLRDLGPCIYHVVDPYQVFPNDPDFARAADLVVTVNPWFLDQYRKLNPNTIEIPHGVRQEDLEHEPAAVRALQEKWGRYLIVAAGINLRINYGLLMQVARRFPDLRLVLAGPLGALRPDLRDIRDRLLSMPNVVYAGLQHPDRLRDLINGAVAGLVAYSFEATESMPSKAGRTPLKVITYLAQFRPVISTINSYTPALDGHGHFKAENDAHFLELIGQVVQGRLAVDQPVVRAYLDSIGYKHLIASILHLLPRTGAGRDFP